MAQAQPPAAGQTSSASAGKLATKKAERKGKRRQYFCVCNPRMKKDRVPTRLYCLRHWKFVCEDCLDSEERSHTTCQIADYYDWVQAHGNVGRNSYHSVCPLCNKNITDKGTDNIRLTCGGYCVFHYSCINKHLLATLPKKPPILTPKDPGVQCPSCKSELFLPLRPKTNLQKHMIKLFRLLPSGRSYIRHTERPEQTVILPKPPPKPTVPRRKRASASGQPPTSSPREIPDLATSRSRAVHVETNLPKGKSKRESHKLLLSEPVQGEQGDLEGQTDTRKGYESKRKFLKRLYFTICVNRHPVTRLLFFGMSCVLLIGIYTMLSTHASIEAVPTSPGWHEVGAAKKFIVKDGRLHTNS